jgi:hypothetical protein
MDPTDTTQLRIQALDFAIRHSGGRADTRMIVKTAQSFYEFLIAQAPTKEPA